MFFFEPELSVSRFRFYDTMFPGQVRRAEMIRNTTALTELIGKRQGFIERYERVYEGQVYLERSYEQSNASFLKGERNGCGCKWRKPTKPKKHQVSIYMPPSHH